MGKFLLKFFDRYENPTGWHAFMDYVLWCAVWVSGVALACDVIMADWRGLVTSATDLAISVGLWCIAPIGDRALNRWRERKIAEIMREGERSDG